jgi:hypothetical protein
MARILALPLYIPWTLLIRAQRWPQRTRVKDGTFEYGMPKWVFPLSPGSADIEIVPQLGQKRLLVRRQDVDRGTLLGLSAGKTLEEWVSSLRK